MKRAIKIGVAVLDAASQAVVSSGKLTGERAGFVTDSSLKGAEAVADSVRRLGGAAKKGISGVVGDIKGVLGKDRK